MKERNRLKVILDMLGIDTDIDDIGSDAHSPCDIGAGIQAQLAECVRFNINSIVYYQQRQKKFMPITDFL